MAENFSNSEVKQKFDIYYEQKILPALKSMESLRKKKLRTFYIMTLITILWLSLRFICWEIINPYSDLYGIFGFILACITGFPIISYYGKSKENILGVLVNFFGDFTYMYQKRIDERKIAEAQILKYYDRFCSDDSFSGKYKNVPINMTEYTLYRRSIRQTDQYVREYYSKIGGGIIFCAQMNKKFEGHTIVAKDKGFLNRFRRFKTRNILNGKYELLKRVGIESLEFEKKFEVYTDNQIEARYILTTAMIEHMLKLTKRFPIIQFSFKDEQILINIESAKNHFECSSFFSTLINKSKIERNFMELYNLFMIIDILRLNQKQIL